MTTTSKLVLGVRYTILSYLALSSGYCAAICIYSFFKCGMDCYDYFPEKIPWTISFFVGMPGALVLFVLFVFGVGIICVGSIGWLFTGKWYGENGN